MNFQNRDIVRLRSNVDRQMVILKNKMEKYRILEERIINYTDQMNGDIGFFSFGRPDISELASLEKLALKYRELENDRFKLTREIDNISSIIAGSLKVAIDACMASYSISLKHWIRRTILDMATLREVNNPLVKLTNFSFPSATAVLIPYLYITQTFEPPQKFAIVRNAIRDLIY